VWQPKERKMEYFAGLDVSLETVNVCIVNAAGDILLEKKIATGHSGTQTPQSMHSSGWMTSMFSPS
ncbi:MAG: hypothetical protein WA661_00090, partial [Xanthobacteraceae bacterium]